QAVEAILADLKDTKADPAERASAADALYLSGDRRAVPTLVELEKSGSGRAGKQKGSARRPSSAIALARIAGKETYEPFKTLAEKETEVEGVVCSALTRTQVAHEGSQGLACL